MPPIDRRRWLRLLGHSGKNPALSETVGIEPDTLGQIVQRALYAAPPLITSETRRRKSGECGGTDHVVFAGAQQAQQLDEFFLVHGDTVSFIRYSQASGKLVFTFEVTRLVDAVT